MPDEDGARELDEKIEALRRRKSGVVCREDVIFILTEIAEINATLAELATAIKQRGAAAEAGRVNKPEAVDNSLDDGFQCVNCGDIQQEKLAKCPVCDNPLNWGGE